MFRLWGKLWRSNRLLKDTVICLDIDDTRTHKIFQALEDICLQWDLEKPIWLDANIRIPEGFTGMERVVVQFYVNPDGSITEPRIIRRPSKNDAVNAEALRLVNALPKFRVKYSTPKKHRFRYNLPITFKEPGAVFIRGNETD